MSSLANRLQQMQMPASETRPDLTHLSLDQLRNQKINFGRTHTGRTYQHMWGNEQGWIMWFVQRYSESSKAEHLTFLRYVELEVERAELSGTQVPVINLKDIERVMNIPGTSDTKVTHAPVLKAKAKSQAQIPSPTSVWDDEEDPRLFEDLTEPQVSETPRISSFKNRMAGLENAVTSIMQHLETMASEASRAVKSLECPNVLASHVAGDPSADCHYSHDVSTSPQTSEERIKFQKLVQQFSQELQTIQSQTTINSKRTDVIEVFCGPDSQLTHQTRNLGFKADRFSRQQGDLPTTEGRHLFFQKVCHQNPKNICFSPSCGPWSGFACLNGSRSLSAWDALQQTRLLSLEQIALGVVLLRHQHSRNSHFHREQPRGSLMFKLAYVQEVLHYLLAIDVDLCVAGELKDLLNGMMIMKTLTILSTARRMIDALTGLRCSHQHEHQTIEGQTNVNEVTMNRSTFTENYPRRFARRLALAMCKIQFPREEPYRNEM